MISQHVTETSQTIATTKSASHEGKVVPYGDRPESKKQRRHNIDRGKGRNGGSISDTDACDGAV